MKISLSGLEKLAGEFVHFSYEGTLATLGIDVPGNRDAMMDVTLDASYVSGKVMVKGKWKLELKETCSRCLEQTVCFLEEEFDEVFTRFQEAPPGDDPDDSVPEAEDFLVFRGEVLDLAEYLRQSFFMAQPLKVVCHKDCRGLCPVCGVNRNSEECNCSEETIDPRLRVLKGFKKE